MLPVKRTVDVIFLLICLSAFRESVADKSYYLPRNVQSVYYKLHFSPNFEKKTFEIDSNWIFNITERNIIYLNTHEKNLKCPTSAQFYRNVTWNDFQRRRSVVKQRFRRNDQEPSDIVENYYGHIMYEFNIQMYRLHYYPACAGLLTNNMEGFYLDEYPDENHRSIQYVTTQFGPIGARYAHPCSDEPYFRSKFKIILTRPNDYTCITNTNLKKSTRIGNLMQDEFESTELISPSSVAFTISKMQISPEQTGSIHRIVARPEVLKAKNHEEALQLINRAYGLIEKFFQIGCELERLYHVTLPSNKMKFESLGTYWGINHYKENVLIITKQTTLENKETSTIAINKLLAQQWFLSYLMVDSWTWAWVNDGLTMYASYNVTNQLHPEWLIYERLQSDTRLTMELDSRCCSLPLNKEAMTPSQIRMKNNPVTVYKGTAMFTMMERILPPLAFTQSIKILISDKKWSTYKSADLYERVEKLMKLHNLYEKTKLPKKFTEIMSTWERLMAYPLITVTRNYDTYDLEKVSLVQKRFYYEKVEQADVWPIPINYATKHNPNFNNNRPTSWMVKNTGKLIIESLKKTDWLILNNQATYFYRVNYDAQNWILITEALKKNHENIHHLNRMQLIDDAFSLAEFGELRYSTALDLTSYIKKERDYGPLKSMHDVYVLISKKLVGSKPYNEFKIFIRKSMEHIYGEFVKILKNPSSVASPSYHRNRRTLQFLFSWLCDLESPKCNTRKVKASGDIFDLLHSSIFEKHELRNNMKTAKDKEWDEFFEKYKSENNANSKLAMSSVLACCSSPAVTENFLLFVIRFQSFNLIAVVKQIVAVGAFAVTIVLNHIGMIFECLLRVFNEAQIIDCLNAIGSAVTTQYQLDIVRINK